jgi:hypothetical protein
LGSRTLADGALVVSCEPVVDALLVELVKTGESPHLLSRRKVSDADYALPVFSSFSIGSRRQVIDSGGLQAMAAVGRSAW